MNIVTLISATLMSAALLSSGNIATAQSTNTKQPVPVRMLPPTRDPHTPGYVTAIELPDGAIPSPGVNGNFIIGPIHNPAPETRTNAQIPLKH